MRISSLCKMAAEYEEQRLKKRLKYFLDELCKVGTVKGFKYFDMYMRGKEEMVIRIQNEPVTPQNGYMEPFQMDKPFSSVPSYFHHQSHGNSYNASNSFNSRNLPYDKRSLMLSSHTQRQLSNNDDCDGIGLPPASPSETEMASVDGNSTLFLLAGYARYNCPYAWVRTNHQRLIRLNNDEENEKNYKDYPLKLKTTMAWSNEDIQPWNVLAELVKLCTRPAPYNPFEVDLEFFDTLPVGEKVLASGAMVNFLQKVLMHDKKDKAYTHKAFEDLQIMTKLHFQSLKCLIQLQGLPILQDHETSQQTAFKHHRRQFSAIEKGYKSQMKYSPRQ